MKTTKSESVILKSLLLLIKLYLGVVALIILLAIIGLIIVGWSVA